MFTWDENKRRSNLKRHNLDFTDAESVFVGEIVTLEDTRFDYGEQRFLTFGRLQGRVVAIAHTEQADRIRIISMRKASRHEQQAYFESI